MALISALGGDAHDPVLGVQGAGGDGAQVGTDT
jgi:hypothetical protein